MSRRPPRTTRPDTPFPSTTSYRWAGANSAARRTAKITAATKAPGGGRIETANGQPSGVFVDAATDLIAAVVPRPLARDRDRAFLLAQARLLEQGITTIADMGTTIEDWQA